MMSYTRFDPFGKGSADEEEWDDFAYEEDVYEEEKEALPRRRGPRVGRWLFLFFLGALLVAGLALVPRIETYTVTGSQALTVQDVVEMCSLEAGTHLFAIDRPSLREAIENDPHYQVVGIVYRFPNSLEIKVSERSRDACVRHLDKDVIIASDGTVLEVGQAGAFSDVLRLQGVMVTGYALGEHIGVQDDFQLSVAGKVLEVLRRTGYVVDYDLIDLSNPVDLKLLSKNRITVRIGQMEGMEEKLGKVAVLLRQLANDGHYGGVLDASTEKPAYRNSSLGGIEIPREMLTPGESGGIANPPEEMPVEDWTEQFVQPSESGGTAGGATNSSGSREGDDVHNRSSSENGDTPSRSTPTPDLPEEGGTRDADTEEHGDIPVEDILDEVTEENELPGMVEEGVEG